MTSPSESASTPRVSTNDRPQPGPIALFEHHLRYLQDSYLSFFQERAKIEEVYIDALQKLHKKTKTMDVYLDHATEPSTIRQVWSEIRDGVEREAQSRMAFLQALAVDVINPIATLKETQDRTRKRIKDDIKESINAHQDYAENVLPRLKRFYLRKAQEVEDNKANALSPAVPFGADTPVTLAPTRSNPNTSPVVTNPQPLRPLTRRASGHHPQSRNRSPSTSNPLQDLAHQGKRQLNQLMTFLDNRGGSLKDNVAGVRGDVAIRTVKAKREADEADKEYRKGIHWLETLRIRRSKILEGAFKSLELFIDESSNKMKSFLERYTANMMATSTTIAHLSTHAQEFVSHIAPQKDISFVSVVKTRYLQQSTPKRVLYTNYYVGDCSDLIFGVGLVDYATSRGLRDGDVPKLLRICIAEVEKRGLNSEGIYRVSGRHAVVQEMIHKVEKDEKNFQFYPSDDIFVVASLLKQYLRELPEPLFKYSLEDRVKHTEDLDEHVQNNFLFLRGRLRRLPAVHQATVKTVVEHLSHVAANCERNKMDAKNLAIIFGGVVFGEDDIPKATDLLSIQSWKDSLMEDLIVHANVLFDDHVPISQPYSPQSLMAQNSPLPLPLVGGDEQLSGVGYGSPYTLVTDVSSHQQDPDAPTSSSQDFTPQLPPRPGNSIHPSRRATFQPTRTGGSETDEESDPVAPALPPRPLRPQSVEVKPTQIYESPVAQSQMSSTPEQHDDISAGGEFAPSLATSSPPTSLRTPLTLSSEIEEDSRSESRPSSSRQSQEQLPKPL
ncbi:hypothetical protein DFH11DRAFT_1560466 [Phellopilus nigrolimitatus]|nr:hypothetical protein DFH11DRAFT_1560466 [Phellopilus nigrolimitatus]